MLPRINQATGDDRWAPAEVQSFLDAIKVDELGRIYSDEWLRALKMLGCGLTPSALHLSGCDQTAATWRLKRCDAFLHRLQRAPAEAAAAGRATRNSDMRMLEALWSALDPTRKTQSTLRG